MHRSLRLLSKRVWKGTEPLHYSESAAQGKALPKSPSQLTKEAAHARIGNSNKKGPVSWSLLGFAAVAAATGVSYYSIERERRFEKAMGTVVSSESKSNNNDTFTWSPGRGWAPVKFKLTEWGWFPEEKPCAIPGKPAIGGTWSLIDMEGRLVTEKTFQGKYTLLYFGFARCPDICPSEMVKVGTIMDRLYAEYPALAKQIQPVFVTVDPARDSIETLQEYAKDFHPDYLFLTGTPEQIQRMAKKYRVYVSKADETEDGDYLVDHSIVLYFHDEQGEMIDFFTQSMKPTDIVGKIHKAMTFVPSY